MEFDFFVCCKFPVGQLYKKTIFYYLMIRIFLIIVTFL
jgi:hypothetical protein